MSQISTGKLNRSKNLIGPASQVSCHVSYENHVKKLSKPLNTWKMIYSSMFVFPCKNFLNQTQRAIYGLVIGKLLWSKKCVLCLRRNWDTAGLFEGGVGTSCFQFTISKNRIPFSNKFISRGQKYFGEDYNFILVSLSKY